MKPVDARRVVIRLLWRSVADGNTCTCVGNDECPECEAFRLLGLGRWPGAELAGQMLFKEPITEAEVRSALAKGAEERKAAERTLKRSPRR